MTSDMRRCAWHECGRMFVPGHPREKFCSHACQRARGAWKARRGGPLVDPLLNDDAATLLAARRKIQKEIDDATAKAD